MFWSTGSGKSFTVLYIIERLKRSAVMILPTLALMMNLCNELAQMKITFVALSSLQSNKEYQVMSDCINNRPKVLLSTPEAVVKYSKYSFFQDFHNKVGIDLLVSEEAHCDFLWETFRTEFNVAKSIFQKIPDLQRIAISASPPAGDASLLAGLCNLQANFYLSKHGLYRADLSIAVLCLVGLN